MAFPQWCEVWRRGKTQPRLTQELALVTLDRGGPTDQRRDEAGITLTTEIASKGGGDTRVRIFIDPGGYEELASQMMQSAPEAAMVAFGKAIAGQAGEPTFTRRLPFSLEKSK